MRDAEDIFQDATIEQYINNPRKEAIEECADLLNPECSERMKKSILSLIKELK